MVLSTSVSTAPKDDPTVFGSVAALNSGAATENGVAFDFSAARCSPVTDFAKCSPSDFAGWSS